MANTSILGWAQDSCYAYLPRRCSRHYCVSPLLAFSMVRLDAAEDIDDGKDTHCYLKIRQH